ncbi:MAG: class I SAM-dependent methyltransferase [Acidobacteriota bacterium]|nr:class I SAM-dependent methyltransferase [Acidobacteriota bacterium]
MRNIWLGLVAVSLMFAQAQKQQNRAQEDRSRATYEGAYDPTEPLRFNPEPNSFLMECIKDRRPGRALDVGMGNGRNSIALAQAGWDVTGFDIASAGVEQARKKASERGLKLKALVKSEQQFDFGVNQWDLIVLTYQPFRDILAVSRRA